MTKSGTHLKITVRPEVSKGEPLLPDLVVPFDKLRTDFDTSA